MRAGCSRTVIGAAGGALGVEDPPKRRRNGRRLVAPALTLSTGGSRPRGVGGQRGGG